MRRLLPAALGSRWAFLALATLAYWLSTHALRPLIPLLLDQFGTSDALIGVIVALYPLSGLALAIPGGRLIDRVGLRRILLLSLAVMALLGIAFGRATGALHIAVLLVVSGLAEVGVWLALQALSSHAGSGQFRTRQLALFSLGWGVGIAAGPVIGAALFERWSFAAVGLAYTVGSLAAAAAVLLVPFRDREVLAGGGPPASTLSGIRGMWGSPPVRITLLSSFVVLFVQGIRQSFYPLFLERAGLSIPSIGLLLSVMGVASLLVRLPLPWLLRRWGADRVLMLSMWLAVAGITATPMLGTFELWLVAAIVTGAGVGVNPPVTVELMARHTAPGERGLAMGMRLTSNRLAQVVQPMMFGGLAGVAGLTGAFTVAGAALAALVLTVARNSSAVGAPSSRG